MRLSPLVAAAVAGVCFLAVAAYALTKRTHVPVDFSADDFRALVVQSIGEAGSAFGSASTVEVGAFKHAKAVYIQRHAHGDVTLFIDGVSINSAREDLEKRLNVSCAENGDFQDLPARSGIILGKLSYTCTSIARSVTDGKIFAGYVLMIDSAAGVGHLYQVVGRGIPEDVARSVVDRVYARLRHDYANRLVLEAWLPRIAA
jgi:hypothetical protein